MASDIERPDTERPDTGRPAPDEHGAMWPEILIEAARSATAIGPGVACTASVLTGLDGAVRSGSSDAFAAEIAHIEQGLGEGPAAQALTTGTVVDVADLTLEHRWPIFRTTTRRTGLAGVHVEPVYAPGGVLLGALAWYFRAGAPRPAEAPGDSPGAEYARLARTAETAFRVVLPLAGAEQREQDLRAALASRTVIGQATGIVMAQQGCTAEQALALLRSESQQRNVKLRDLAVERVGPSGPGPTGFRPRGAREEGARPDGSGASGGSGAPGRHSNGVHARGGPLDRPHGQGPNGGGSGTRPAGAKVM